MESKRLYELGIASYNRSNFKEAFEYFNQTATLGSSEAEYLLAEVYREGKCVNKDFDKSLSLYKKLLDVDDDFSISDFTALNNGQVDIKEVIDWFVEAANEENQTAENKLKNFVIVIYLCKSMKYCTSLVWKSIRQKIRDSVKSLHKVSWIGKWWCNVPFGSYV